MKKISILVGFFLNAALSAMGYDGAFSPSETFLHMVPLSATRTALEQQTGYLPQSAQLEPILGQIMALEKQYAQHDSFVHGYNTQLFTLGLLYKQLCERVGIPLRQDYFPIRRPADLCRYSVLDYIDTYGIHIDNYQDDHQRQLLSVNLTATGNEAPAESALAFFLTNRSIEIPADIICSYLSDFDPGFSARYTGLFKKIVRLELARITALLSTRTGCFLQILIPKYVTPRIVYLSQPVGRPVTNKIKLSMRFFESGYDASRGCYTDIRPLLDAYQENPLQWVDFFKQAQARIIMHQELLTNQEIKIIPHLGLDSGTLQVYNRALDDFIQLFLRTAAGETSIDEWLNVLEIHMHEYAVVDFTQLIVCLVANGLFHQQALKLAKKDILQIKFEYKKRALKIARVLIKQGHEREELIPLLKLALQDKNEKIRRRAQKIMKYITD